jgi:hypothetical protein
MRWLVLFGSAALLVCGECRAQDLQIFEKDSYLKPSIEFEYMEHGSIVLKSVAYNGLATLNNEIYIDSANTGFEYMKLTNLAHYLIGENTAAQLNINLENFRYNYLLEAAEQSQRYLRSTIQAALYYKEVRFYLKFTSQSAALSNWSHSLITGMDLYLVERIYFNASFGKQLHSPFSNSFKFDAVWTPLRFTNSYLNIGLEFISAFIERNKNLLEVKESRNNVNLQGSYTRQLSSYGATVTASAGVLRFLEDLSLIHTKTLYSIYLKMPILYYNKNLRNKADH